jgi:2-dehydro-3-deoxyphosphogluconate aldolase/(4S)-4-hydroxy-2-oxoglutarate aldolase
MEYIMTVSEKIGLLGLVPVIVFNNEEEALPTAKALIEAGLPIMEITLRTKQGLPAIKAIKEKYPEILMGAGTVLSVEQAKAAVDAGAEFIVSPGFNDDVVSWCIDNDIAVTPGCVTPTEIEHALKFGLNVLKFFPASIYGGIKGCKALYGPYRMIKFIPTGGVNLSTLSEYADKEFIHAIGGGWLCSGSDVASGNYTNITKTVKDSIDVLLGFELEDAESKEEVATNNLDRAAFYLESKGYEVKNKSDNGVVMSRNDGSTLSLIAK